jgi:hypothetical protein
MSNTSRSERRTRSTGSRRCSKRLVVEPGDMLLIHTGFASKVLEWSRDPDPVEIHRMCTYLDANDDALLEWIAESSISALVADNYAVEGLVGGMWYLHELAAWLREHNRSRFLLTAPPLRMPGVVGSPLTPIATV